MTYNHIPQILENRPEIAVKLITLEQVEKAIKHSDRAIIPVVGDCMEAAGIMDGGWVAVDFTHHRRFYPLPECVLCSGTAVADGT